jgi:hypothetical protein
MTGYVAGMSIHEKTEQARKYFASKAATLESPSNRELFSELRNLAESIEGIESLLEHLSSKLDALLQRAGHLETSGSVPHTRRR